MSIHDIIPALPSASDGNKLALRAAILSRTAYWLDEATDPQTFDPRDVELADVVPVIAWHDAIWFRDAGDTVTAHDGITCIVTLDGSRYFSINVTAPGGGVTAAGQIVRIQKFAGSGTYVPHPAMIYALIEAWAGGGAGGSCAGHPNYSGGGGGGGAGQKVRKWATAAVIGASRPVIIGGAGVPGAAGFNNGGSGGDTSVGSTLALAKGGHGGAGSQGAQGTGGVGGGFDGTGNGDLLGIGESGGDSNTNVLTANTVQPVSFGGRGGNSEIGAGGLGGIGYLAANPGYTATGCAAGGGGAGCSVTSATQVGGYGAPGFVMITEFCAS